MVKKDSFWRTIQEIPISTVSCWATWKSWTLGNREPCRISIRLSDSFFTHPEGPVDWRSRNPGSRAAQQLPHALENLLAGTLGLQPGRCSNRIELDMRSNSKFHGFPWFPESSHQTSVGEVMGLNGFELPASCRVQAGKITLLVSIHFPKMF